jgi:hypothetical protein
MERMREAWAARRERLPRDHGHLGMLHASMSYVRQFAPPVLGTVRSASRIELVSRWAGSSTAVAAATANDFHRWYTVHHTSDQQTWPRRPPLCSALRTLHRYGSRTNEQDGACWTGHSTVGKPLWGDNELGWFPCCGGGCNNNDVVRFH